MKKLCFFLFVFSSQLLSAQLYVAPGDSISVLPGTLFTLQEDLVNNGKIFNGGILTLNGTGIQSLSGTGSTIDNLTADNHAVLINDLSIVNALQLNAANIFDLGSSTLANTGNVNGTGFIKGSLNADIQLNGSAASSIRFDQANNEVSNALRNITVGNGAVTVLNKLYVYDAVLPSSGSIQLDDELVLRSNSSKTARVGVAGSSFSYGVNGKFVIERYIPGRRAWRLLTAPVTAADNIKISDAWQDSKPRVTNVNIISNPEPGYGTHVTFGFPSTNGYDQGVNGNPSIRYLNSSGWNGVPSATNDGSIANSGIITDQPGYMLFVRGDRGTLLSQATSAITSPTVLRPKGKIHTGVVNQPLSTAFVNGGSSFRVVGNPYASSVNFHSVVSNPVNAANGFTDEFYLWDPAITGSNGVGGFVAMSYNAAASIIAGYPVYDRSVSSSIDNSGDIQSSAAIVVDYAGPATSMRFEEDQKTTGSNNSFFRPVRQLHTSLLAENADSSVSVNDGVLISFDEAMATEEVSGMKKLGNFSENIAVSAGNGLYCIERRRPITAGDTIFYFISRLRQKNYQLQFFFAPDALPAGVAPYLEDGFTKTTTALQAIDSSFYRFAVTDDTNSFAAGRFRLLFKNINRFVSLAASCTGQQVLLQWAVTDTAGIVSFVVERSLDGINFSFATATVPEVFTSADAGVLPGTYYYRVKCLNSKGVATYSAVVKVVVPFSKYNCYVYPNPVTDHNCTFIIKNAVAGVYQLTLLNSEGQTFLQQSVQHAGGTLKHPVRLPGTISAGTYIVEAIGPDKKRHLAEMIVE
jgi:hypothetical protein